MRIRNVVLCVIVTTACFVRISPADPATAGATAATTAAEQPDAVKPADQSAAGTPATTSPAGGSGAAAVVNAPRGIFDAKRSKTLGVSLYYGSETSWKEILPGIDKGFTLEIHNAPMDKKFLDEIGILIIPGCKKDQQYGLDEIEMVSDFVASGGGLLCGSQAWSWIDRKYGNKPLATFPLNTLGVKIGFLISARVVGYPVPSTADPTVFGAIKSWSHSSNWTPSDVLPLFNTNVTVLLRDAHMSCLILSGRHGAGQFVVAGHDRIFADNPEALKAVLRLLKPR